MAKAEKTTITETLVVETEGIVLTLTKQEAVLLAALLGSTTAGESGHGFGDVYWALREHIGIPFGYKVRVRPSDWGDGSGTVSVTVEGEEV